MKRIFSKLMAKVTSRKQSSIASGFKIFENSANFRTVNTCHNCNHSCVFPTSMFCRKRGVLIIDFNKVCDFWEEWSRKKLIDITQIPAREKEVKRKLQMLQLIDEEAEKKEEA